MNMRHPAKFYLLIMVVLTGFASAQVQSAHLLLEASEADHSTP
jgi:hypothetical protein